MSESSDSVVPPVDFVLGHYFDGREVHIVFRDPEDAERQFIVIKEERARLPGKFLEKGASWARHPQAPVGNYSQEWKAFHEAGHAVMCVREGIKVEFVTAVPSPSWGGEPTLGYCQYDYRLSQARAADPPKWAEKVAKAHLGGLVAETLYWERAGQKVPASSEQGWGNDLYLAKKEVISREGVDLDKVDLATGSKLFRSAEVGAELDRLREAVGQDLLDPPTWEAVCRVAARLGAEGAALPRSAPFPPGYDL
jgi:hypothetical protein